jgi:hypothetical protein
MDADPRQMRHYAELADSTEGPLGQVYRLLSRPRMHVGGAEDACTQLIIAIELATSADDLRDARSAIAAFEQGGWGMYAAKLRPALAAAEARLK